MDARSLGVLLVVVGAAVAAIGVLVAVGAFGWFGRLPGDLRFGSDNVRVYVPLASTLLLSVVLTVVINLVRRLW